MLTRLIQEALLQVMHSSYNSCVTGMIFGWGEVLTIRWF